MRNKKYLLGMFFLFVILMSISLASSTYVRTVTSGAQYAMASGLSGYGSTQSLKFDKSMCGAEGQDLLVQIVPFGCIPSVVRSDLLEEQDVQVLCQLGATQINPLIDIEAIDYMTITGEHSNAVRGVGYFPSQAALGTVVSKELELSSPILSNLGYAVITLKKQSNESAMPNYVTGNLTAKIRYDIKSAFGVGDVNFYLPALNDEEWNQKFEQYSFWQGRGYLRALSVDDSGAQIAIYADDSVVTSGAFSREGKTYSKVQYSSFYLKEGASAEDLYLPGFSPCLATLSVRLTDLVNPETRAKFKVGSDYVEVGKNEYFLNNKCQLKSIDKQGLYQSVKVYCKDDNKPITQTLSFSPRIKLKIDGVEGEYGIGDWLFTTADGKKSVYLGHVDSFGNSEKSEDLFAYLVALPVHKDKLSSDELASINSQANTFKAPKTTGASAYDAIVTSIDRLGQGTIALGQWTVKGEEFFFTSYKNPNTGVVSASKEVEGKQISIMGFGEGEDKGVFAIAKDEYTLVPTTSGEYKIQESDGSDTGLILKEVKTNDGKISLILKKGTSTYGTFYPTGEESSCTSYAACSGLTLSTESNLEAPKDNSFFENLLGAEVIPNQGKLIVSRAVFADSSETTFNSYYEKAMEDFQTIDVSFADEQSSESSTTTYGEEALYEAISLASQLNRKKTMLELCDKFSEKYSKSILYADVLRICENDYQTSSDELSSTEVSIEGVITRISFEGISEPTSDDYGVELLVQGPNGDSRTLVLEKDKIVNLNEFRNEPVSSGTEYVKLGALTTTTASIYSYVLGESGVEKAFVSNTKSLELDTPYTPSVKGGYTFTLKKINLQKSAKVSIIGNTNHEYTNATFGFKVGIEKRSFPLTPEKASDKIEALNSSLTDIKKASDALAKTVTVMKNACLLTGGALTLKNLVGGLDGKSIARQKVMRGADGWTEKCTDAVTEKTYSSLDQCFLKNSDDIDSEVNEMYQTVQSQNEVIKSLENAAKNSQGNIEIKKVVEGLSSGTISDLDSSVQAAVNLNREDKVDFTKLNTLLTADRFSKNAYSLEQLKEISLYTEILKTTSDSGLKETATERLYNVLNAVEVNSQTYEAQEIFRATSGLGDSSAVMDLLGKKTQEVQVTDIKKFSNSVYSQQNYVVTEDKIDSGEYVYAVEDRSNIQNKYLIVYSKDGGVERTYRIDDAAKTLTIYTEGIGSNTKVVQNPLNLFMKIITEESLTNTYKNAKLKYYEEAPYKGKPAIVPFSTKEGWYAAIKPFVASESLQAVDDSGVVKVFWVCNVGKDGLEDFFSSSRDDICAMYNLRTGQALNQFGGLSENKASTVIRAAQEAISQAQRAYASGVSRVRISTAMGTETFNVGTPAVEIPEFQCQDFMSPKECNILFNVCDPVVCPSSRCDLGGTYPVQDVVQSGIIGSIALCLPNIKEGIVIPVCISGVQAGLDGFISVQESYRDCLQTNIDTGATVGICDEVYSIYLCDFFWKQALPLAKLTVPKVLSAILGQNARGGGEYLGVKDALAKAKDSIEYFKSNYAANSWKAFKLRSTEEVGGEVCQNFPSIVTFDVQSLLSDLTEPDSPFQFTGNFQESAFTTATNPALSHYKVFYHIYAGKDAGAYYLVYLRQGTGSSYYQDTTSDKRVASGYIPIGGYATNTTDFTAPSGYKQLCISVNGQEDCSFERVSSSFALDYLSELYVKEQSTEQVTTDAECISGTASWYSILNPNVQDIVEELIDPKIYENGIIRTCATENPGKATDSSWEDPKEARWVSVGYCGDTNVKCWLDRDKVKEIVKSLNIENEIIQDTSANYAETLFKQGNYLTTEQFENNITTISSQEPLKKIELINSLFPKVFFNNQKAQLFLMRGKAYAGLALDSYAIFKNQLAETKAAAEIAKQKAGEKTAEGCDKAVGEKILSAAINKLGTDTTRTENGKEVYDNVCATFVSKALIDAGVFAESGTCSPDTSYMTTITNIVTMFQASESEYGYFNEIEKEYWKTGLLPGDIIIWGCQPQAPECKKDYQHITIFSNYDGKGGIRIIHDPGEKTSTNDKKVAYKTYTNPIESSSWYITHVWRAGCSKVSGVTSSIESLNLGIIIKPIDIESGEEIPEQDVEPDGEPIESLPTEYIFGSQLLHPSIYLKYNKEWYYCFGDITHITSPCDKTENWHKVSEVGTLSGSTHKEIFEIYNANFDKKSYEEGLIYLIDKAKLDDESLAVKGEDFSAELNPDGSFVLEKAGNSIDLIFNTNDNDWKWKAHDSKIEKQTNMDPWSFTFTPVLQSNLCGYCERYTGSCTLALKKQIDNECELSKENVKGFEVLLPQLNDLDFYSGAKTIFESLK